MTAIHRLLESSARKPSAVVASEIRNAFLQAPFWIFGTLVLAFTVAMYAGFSHLHDSFASFAAPGTYLSPRFLVGRYGAYTLWLSLVGAVFVGLARTPHALTDVLDSKPISNIALIAGRVTGLACMVWFPIVCSFSVIQVIGWFAQWSGWRFGDTIESHSLAAFVFVDSAPTILTWCSIIVLLFVVIRNRLLTALVAFLILAGAIWLSTRIPVYLSNVILPITNYAGFASDIVPELIPAPTAVQRAGMLSATAGVVAVTASLYRRRDDHRSFALVIGIALVACSAAFVGLAAFSTVADMRARENWFDTHVAASSREIVGIDLEQVRGHVHIAPGNVLRIDIDMVARIIESDSPSLMFSLNPGMAVDSLLIDGIAHEFSHEQGLLIINLDQPPKGNAQLTISLSAQGIPESGFAYLDSAVDPERQRNTSRLWQLGDEAGMYEPTYVALMPATHWLPSPGPNINRDDPSLSATDFFSVDLIVDVPHGWLVAGPGRRYDATHESESNDASSLPQQSGFSRFFFRPAAIVSEIGLLASDFEHFGLHVRGTTFELLLHRSHADSLRFFADTEDGLRDRISSLLAEADALGLSLLYDNLSLVEVPAPLRTYRGGWRAKSAFTLPGVLLFKEVALVGNHSRFDARLARGSERVSEVDQKIDHMLKGVFYLDEHGAALGRGFAHNLFNSVTSARGPSGTALNALLLELTDWLINSSRPITDPWEANFSAHSFDNDEGFAAPVVTLLTWLAYGRLDHLFVHTRGRVDRPPIWEGASLRSLTGLGNAKEDAELDASILALKTKRISKGILDMLGRDRTAALVAEIRRRHIGNSFELSDFVDVGQSIDPQITSFVVHWINTASLAGFVSSQADVMRLEEGDDTRYRTLVRIHNDQPAPGIVYISTTEGSSMLRSQATAVAALESVVVEMSTREHPSEVWLHTHLALNRHPFRVPLFSDDVGSSVLELAAPRSESFDSLASRTYVVVDDLDLGFSVRPEVVVDPGRVLPWWLRPYEYIPDIDLGLPEYRQGMQSVARGTWLRESAPGAWGKHRRTLAVMRMDERGGPEAAFKATLPTVGLWRLDFHVPRPPRQRNPLRRAHVDYLGLHRLALLQGGVEYDIEFDVANAQPGWNDLGTFDIRSLQVTVVVSSQDRGDGVMGDLIVADAIRWRRMGRDP